MNEVELSQNEIIEEFMIFDNWIDKYQYIIELGRELTPLKEDEKIEKNKIKGCQSQVWFVPEYNDNRLVFRAISDAAIVSGLIALLMRVFSNRTAEEILSVDLKFLDEIGLDTHLSPTRKNGLNSMIQAIRNRAQNDIKREATQV